MTSSIHYLVLLVLVLCHAMCMSGLHIHDLQQTILSAQDASLITIHGPLKGTKPLENPKGVSIDNGGVKSGINPDVILKAVDDKEYVESSLVEVNGESESESETETVHAPPAMFLPPNAAPLNALAARIAIRGGNGDTNPLAAPNGGTFRYVTDNAGRVTQAWGFVRLKRRTNLAQAVHQVSIIPTPSHTPTHTKTRFTRPLRIYCTYKLEPQPPLHPCASASAVCVCVVFVCGCCVQYCDTLWYFSPSKYVNGAPSNRVNTQWHSGHVIASALGGSDTDPINFFPQHAKSNSGGGIWWRVEMIVGGAKAVLSNLHAGCEIMIRPTLDYSPLPNDWMPDRGIYYVEIDYGCASLYAGANKPGGLAGVFHNWVTASVNSNMGAGDDPAYSYVNNVFGIGGGTAHGYRYAIAWLNTANKANQLNAANLFN